jgi:hypothetical protein
MRIDSGPVGPKYYTRNYYCGRRGGPVTYQAGALVGLNVTYSVQGPAPLNLIYWYKINIKTARRKGGGGGKPLRDDGELDGEFDGRAVGPQAGCFLVNHSSC